MTTTTVPPTAVPPTAVPRAAEPGIDELAGRVDSAIAALAGLDPAARAVAEEVRDAVEAVHRAGLVTMVRAMRADDGARAVLFDLVDDPVVHLLLSLHGIVRPDPTALAERALAGVRPQLQSHGGDVALVRISDGTAFVRLSGACNGCSMSSVTLRNLVEEALVEGVPTVSAVEVVAAEPSPAFIPLTALRVGPAPTSTPSAADGWLRVGPASDVPEGRLTALDLTAPDGSPLSVVVVNVGQRLAAYRNACAHQGLPLDNAVLDASNGTLTCPWHGFCYDATTGECLSAPGAQLDQLPLRVDAGDVWLRVDG